MLNHFWLPASERRRMELAERTVTAGTLRLANAPQARAGGGGQYMLQGTVKDIA